MKTLQLQKLVVKLIADVKGWTGGFDEAESRIDQIASKATKLGKTMTRRVTVPATAIGVASVKAFSDFNDAMTKSTAIMETTTDQQARMEAQAKKLAVQGVQSSSELAESYFFLASAGLDAEQAIAALPAAQRFATAGAFDMARATDLLTDSQSALGLSVKDATQNLRNMERMSDVLVRANTLANASVEQFSVALTSKAGASLKTFNKDVEEGVAVLAAMADQGIKAELAGNNLSRIMLLLSKSSQSNAKAHKQLGFAVFDSNGKMRNMADIIENLEQVLDGMSDEQKVATLSMLGFEARVQGAILPLIGLSDKIRVYEGELRSASGYTEQVANKQMTSFASKVKMLRNRIQNAAIEIGQRLIPIVEKLMGWVERGIHWWDSLSDSTQGWIVKIVALAAVVGPALIVFGKLVATVGTLIGLMSKLVLLWKAGGAAALALKAGLVVLVGVLAFKLTSALTGATAAYNRFNRAQRESKRLSDELSKSNQRRHTQLMRDIELMEDGADKQAAYASAIAKMKREIAGAKETSADWQGEVDKLDTGFKNFTGNKVLEMARSELKLAQERTAQYEDQLAQLEAAAHDVALAERDAAAVDTNSLKTAMKELEAMGLDTAGLGSDNGLAVVTDPTNPLQAPEQSPAPVQNSNRNNDQDTRIVVLLEQIEENTRRDETTSPTSLLFANLQEQ